MRSFLPAILVAGLIGCDSGSSSPNQRTPEATPLPPPSVTVEEVRGEALDAAIAKHKDKVVVVDLWATWCETCVKKFPHFVSMHKKYADKGLVCISVGMEKLTQSSYAKGGKERVLDYLKKQEAAFPNFIVLEPEKDEVSLTKRLGNGYRLIPLMIVFDKAGRKVWNSDDGPAMTDAQLDKMVEDLLAK